MITHTIFGLDPFGIMNSKKNTNTTEITKTEEIRKVVKTISFFPKKSSINPKKIMTVPNSQLYLLRNSART